MGFWRDEGPESWPLRLGLGDRGEGGKQASDRGLFSLQTQWS